MAKVWTETDYLAAYSNYNRSWLAGMLNFGMYRHALTGLFSRSLFTPSSSVMLVGCGFGYWFEYLETIPGVNLDRIWGVENSGYILGKLNDPAYVKPSLAGKILNVDLTAPTILNDLKPYYGGAGRIQDAVVSTLAIDSMETDAEVQAFGATLESVKSNPAVVIHIILSAIPQELWYRPDVDPQQTARDLGLMVRPRTEWSALLPGHYFLDLNPADNPLNLDAFAFYEPGAGWSWVAV